MIVKDKQKKNLTLIPVTIFQRAEKELKRRGEEIAQIQN